MKNKENKVLGILGYPLKQSMSPILHNFWIKKYKLENYYCKFELEKIDKIKIAIQILKLKGLNVTIPYKKKVIKYLDKTDKVSKDLQAVNTILNNKGKLEGYNTDITGFLLGLKKMKKIDKEMPAIILGAGGSAEAVAYSLNLINTREIFIMNRTKSKAEKIAKKYKNVKVKNWIDYNLINNASLIVNTTSLGMIGYPDLPLSLENVNKHTKIYDIVYNPLETGLIKEARKRNLENVTGLTMFLGQAQESFRLWFNLKPEISSYLIKKIKKNIKSL